MAPTTEELKESVYNNIHWDENSAMEFAIEFAKLHVEAALKEASEKVKLLENGKHTYSPRYIVEEGNHYSEKEIDVDPDSILNSYPLSSIV